jgi:ferredoxin--NADP+ reductase
VTPLRFSNGHFTMIGLRLEGGKPLLRAYSIVSANYEEHLEFLSIKVQDGPLTSRCSTSGGRQDRRWGESPPARC